jgi:S-adenosylmethionine synthetase
MNMMMKPMMSATTMMSRTCEHVSHGHPDKFCDQISDRIIDAGLDAAREEGETDPNHPNHPARQRFAIEGVVKDFCLFLSGEVRMGPAISARVNVADLARAKWTEVGYPHADKLTVMNHLQLQSPELSKSSDNNGAGDQGIMVGYATNETPSHMPLEYEMARSLCMAIKRAGEPGHDGYLPWVRSDAKTQVTIGPNGEVQRVVIACQHAPEVDGHTGEKKIREHMHDVMMERIVRPVLGMDIKHDQVVVNGTGSFIIGGPIGDTGEVGRKIVVDAYGPHVPVGGGAYSGKDPTKVDRSAAYQARQIAKTAVEMRLKGANAVLVHIAYAIGLHQPEMITAVTEAGVDISDWVKTRFPDLSPRAIAESLGLWRDAPGVAWRYQDAANFGHYGRGDFPWEQMAKVSD